VQNVSERLTLDLIRPFADTTCFGGERHQFWVGCNAWRSPPDPFSGAKTPALVESPVECLRKVELRNHAFPGTVARSGGALKFSSSMGAAASSKPALRAYYVLTSWPTLLAVPVVKLLI
jgi:hypothetical protein